MKKLLAITIGIIVGITSSVTMISYKSSFVAQGAITYWDEAVAFGNFFEWKDIFSPSETPKDLYKLIYSKLFVQPEREAINQLAKNFGLTTDEAQRVIDGSITPLFRNPDRRGAILTQEQAYDWMEQMQTEFASYQEIFDIQQEIEVSIAPTEIFANGDLSDSGFDLIHDLSVIEEILFVETVKNSIGDPFTMGLESPYVATSEEQATFEEFTGEAELGGEVSDVQRDEAGENAEDERVDRDGSDDEDADDGDGFEAEYLEEDICAPVDELSQALENFEEESAAANDGESEGGEGSVADDSKDTNDGGSGAEELAGQESLVDENGEISPAPRGEWGSPWCPGIGDVDADGAYSAAGSTFGDAGFASLGDTVNSLINQVAVASAGVDVAGFAVNASICLDTDLKWKKARSYIPGQSCIACEVDEINDVMNKTLYHSFMPNKVSGNLFETAKCKASMSVPLVDINFIALGIPIPTPPSDDKIFGRNMFEEWNKFVERYEPFLGLKPQYDQDYLAEFELETVPEGATAADVFNSVIAYRQDQVSDAMETLENYHLSHDGKNTMLYSQVILGEMQQMTEFFEHMKELYEDVNTEACQPIINKPDIN